MIIIKSIFEVESRFKFKNIEEIFKLVPFTENALEQKVIWEAAHYGLRLFKEDIILRLSSTEFNKNSVESIAYKEADLGRKINVRREYSEIITDDFKESQIVNILGGRTNLKNRSQIIKELEHLGHREFMSFNGESYVGRYEPLNIEIKIMYCNQLKYPLLLEIEKAAVDIKDAQLKSRELLELIEEYRLEQRIITKEPPTLLFESKFLGESNYE